MPAPVSRSWRCWDSNPGPIEFPIKGVPQPSKPIHPRGCRGTWEIPTTSQDARPEPVLVVGLEPTSLAAILFERIVFTISPHQHLYSLVSRLVRPACSSSTWLTTLSIPGVVPSPLSLKADITGTCPSPGEPGEGVTLVYQTTQPSSNPSSSSSAASATSSMSCSGRNSEMSLVRKSPLTGSGVAFVPSAFSGRAFHSSRAFLYL